MKEKPAHAERRQFSASLATAAGVLALDAAPGWAATPGTARLRLPIDPEGLYNVQSISLVVSNVLGSFLLERLVCNCSSCSVTSVMIARGMAVAGWA